MVSERKTPEPAEPEDSGNLILGRVQGQTVHIGDDVVMLVKRVQGGKVSLLFKAPRRVKIVRGELLKAA